MMLPELTMVMSVPRRGAHRIGDHVAEVARVRVDDVRDNPLPLGLRHSLDEEIDADVELVVAQRREVEAGGVEHRDHLIAFEELDATEGRESHLTARGMVFGRRLRDPASRWRRERARPRRQSESSSTHR
jgi:hypothetical protein